MIDHLSRTRRRLGLVVGCVALFGAAGVGTCRAAKPNPPFLTLPLADLGYTPAQQAALLQGQTLFTLHFVDAAHLLVTFDTRGLMKRLPDARADDQDHTVSAVLLELPTGQVLAKTTWRLRDHGQYLFPVGHGRFLLRRRDDLTVLAPVLHLAEGKPFAEESFLQFRREVGYVSVSPGGDLLAIETKAPRVHQAALAPSGAAAAGALAAGTTSTLPAGSAGVAGVPSTREPDLDPAEPQPSGVEIHLVRLVEEQTASQPKLVASAAGNLRARALMEIPATSEGFLDVLQESKHTWDFDFQLHGGKRLELAPFDTSCMPRARFVSRSEFVAFGCRNTEDHQEMAAFNLKGEEMWVNVLSNKQLFPYLATAPEAGRFALSRTVVTGTYVDPAALMPDQLGGQEVTFFQTYDGRPLLKVQTSPVQAAGQNFDISADGLEAAVIRGAAIEVYRLPAESGKDLQAVAEARAMVPPPTSARVSLRSKAAEEAAKTATVHVHDPDASGAVSAAGGTLGDLEQGEEKPAAAATPAEKTNTVGDAPAGPRRAPTLYNPDHPKDPQ